MAFADLTLAVALAFTFIYGSAGLLNQALMDALRITVPPIDFLYSPWGVVLAEITVYTPFIMRPLLAAFSLIETAQIEVAGGLGAGAWRIIGRVIPPAAMPALLAAGSMLNGTVAIVLIAHFVLVSAFTFGSVSAGLSRLAPDFEQVAASLGARPAYCLWRVTLPMLLPFLIAAFSLSFGRSMGELGATVMVYLPGSVTLPVGIFALSDRRDFFEAATLTMILASATACWSACREFRLGRKLVESAVRNSRRQRRHSSQVPPAPPVQNPATGWPCLRPRLRL